MKKSFYCVVRNQKSMYFELDKHFNAVRFFSVML